MRKPGLWKCAPHRTTWGNKPATQFPYGPARSPRVTQEFLPIIGVQGPPEGSPTVCHPSLVRQPRKPVVRLSLIPI